MERLNQSQIRAAHWKIGVRGPVNGLLTPRKLARVYGVSPSETRIIVLSVFVYRAREWLCPR